jgi:hypothetical protein
MQAIPPLLTPTPRVSLRIYYCGLLLIVAPAFDLALDLISIQQVLWRGFHTVIEQSPSHQTNVESKVDLVIKGVFPSVQTRPSLLSVSSDILCRGK